MRKMLLFSFLSVGILLSFSKVHGQWNQDPSENNLILSNAEKGTSTVSNIVTASDGSGGMFVCWTDGRNSVTTGNDIFITKILSNGTIPSGFGLGGKPVCIAQGNQTAVSMVSDGQGGVVIAWTDPRESVSNSNDVYAQRINSNGDPVWNLNGVAIVSSALNESAPAITLISSLEVAIVWRFIGATTNTDLAFNYVALSNGSKSLANDITIIQESNNQTNQQVISDESGGIIVAWQDGRISNGSAGVVAQRYNAGGIRLWDPATGVIVRTPGINSAGLSMISDGDGGAIISWADYRVSLGDPNIFIQRLLASGESSWGNEGKEVTNATGIQLENALVKSGDHFIIGWSDRRKGNTDIDIYAQAYLADGTAVWNSGNPVVVVDVVNNQPVAGTTPVLIPDGVGGATFIWDDRRNGTGNDDIWAQKINASGNPVWSSEGVPVCNRTGSNQNSSTAIAGADGSVLVAWRDGRSGTANSEIYASRLETSGLLPVNFLNLSARAIGKNVLVNWISTNEKLIEYFIIERSLNGIDFVDAGKVNAQNVPGTHSYTFEDFNQVVANSNRYYRIKGVDTDGSLTFSNIAKVNIQIDVENAIRLYPNPANAMVNLVIQPQHEGSFSLRVVDVNGRVVMVNQMQLNPGSQNIQLPIHTLHKGLFKVQVLNNKGEVIGVTSLMKQ